MTGVQLLYSLTNVFDVQIRFFMNSFPNIADKFFKIATIIRFVHQASMHCVIADENLSKTQAKHNEDYNCRVCLKPNVIVTCYAFVNFTSRTTMWAELMTIEDYSRLIPQHLQPYRSLDVERNIFRIPQNRIANMVAINFVTFAFTNDITGNNHRIENGYKTMQQTK